MQAATSCIIAGQCYAADVMSPASRASRAGRPSRRRSGRRGRAFRLRRRPGCTKNDTCSAGACGRAAYTCNDGLACTTDACDGAGGCSATIAGERMRHRRRLPRGETR
ncbi:MAG: hypothetical protein U1F43_35660 [Myxococcota bacterium]